MSGRYREIYGQRLPLVDLQEMEGDVVRVRGIPRARVSVGLGFGLAEP